MHLGIPALLAFFGERRNDEHLVLVTIIGTGGSTYRKIGAMMLISEDGRFEGMISGGCLEGDLLLHARKVFESGGTRFVTYDMHGDDNLVWGLGLGCDGVIHLMLQRLSRESGFGFLQQLEISHSERQACLLALVIQEDRKYPAGTYALLDQSNISVGEPELAEHLGQIAAPWPVWRSQAIALTDHRDGPCGLVIHMPVPVRVLICGAGPDAVPVADFLVRLGWEVIVVDHREAHARAERFPAACSVLCARPEKLEATVSLGEIDAAVVMSHNLENDSHYLGQICPYDIGYIGVLGPTARRKKLCDRVAIDTCRVFGPVGLDIGAELPESIALSLVSEIHAVLNDRAGGSLTDHGGGANE